MSKAVLISIQPKWCEKIASGEKTIEVRKSRPKLETPFKCYIYCTKAKEMHHNGCIVWHEDSLFSADKGEIKYGSSLELWGNNYEHGAIFNGKVIGEFVCDKIDFFFAKYDDHGSADLTPSRVIFGLGNANSELAYLDKCCLTHDELFDYIIYGEDGFGWHITDLKIYDKPKELSEFKKSCPYTDGTYCIENKCEYYGSWTGVCRRWVERPPQSWCYVED